MTSESKMIAVAAAFAMALGATPMAAAAEAQYRPGDAQTGAEAAHDHGAMTHGMPMMGMMGGDASANELTAIHQLVLNHDRITRTVTKLADGIRTVTESDDPVVAQLIKDHVADMVARVETRRDLNLPIESAALRDIMRNGDKVKTSVETTDKGSIVTQISGDPAVVAALQEHAAEVTGIVARGMEAIHTAMMANHGAMGHGMGGGHSAGRREDMMQNRGGMGHGGMGQRHGAMNNGEGHSGRH